MSFVRSSYAYAQDLSFLMSMAQDVSNDDERCGLVVGRGSVSFARSLYAYYAQDNMSSLLLSMAQNVSNDNERASWLPF